MGFSSNISTCNDFPRLLKNIDNKQLNAVVSNVKNLSVNVNFLFMCLSEMNDS